MNGFMMCILLAATGQVDDTAVRDFGWQINPDDGKLEYIVQLSPQKANLMATAAKEQASDVPTEVAARLSRVVVRIGTEPIISTPMEEVMKLPPVTPPVLANIESIAGRGRFSQLENASGGEVKNVSGNGAPPSLSTSPGSLPEAPGTSLAAQASQLGNNLSDALKSDLSDAVSTRGAEALRKAESLLAQNLTPNTPGSAFATDSRSLSSNTGKYSNTATQPATPPAGSTSTPLPGSPASGLNPPSTAGTYPTSPAHNHAPGDGFHNDGTAAAPPLNSSIGGNSGSSSSGSFGTPAYSGSTSSLPGAGTATNTGINPGQPYNGPSGGYSGTAAPGYNQPSGYNNAPPSYGSTAPNYSNGQAYGMTPLNGTNSGGNFGSVPRGGMSPSPYNEYATVGTGNGVNRQYPYGPATPAYSTGSNAPPPVYGGPSSVYASDPLSLPSGIQQQPTRVASNTFPSTSSGTTTTGNGTNAHTPSPSSTSPSTTGKGRTKEVDADAAESYPDGRSGMDNVLPVMFVLSLVVNFYLGMLIRKLLGRYRSLLSSVRSQAV